MTDPIVKTLDLPCTAARAFEIFTRDTARWWPGSYSVSSGAGKAPQAVTIEPRVGGAVFESKYDGEPTPWGEVLASMTAGTSR